MGDTEAAAPGPGSIAALRDAVRTGREPPPAQIVARHPSYWWFVIGTVCIGAFMGQVDSSIAQLLLPRLELEFNARLTTVSWVAVAHVPSRGWRKTARPDRACTIAERTAVTARRTRT